MAKQITDRPAEFCLIACPFMELKLHSNKLYNEDQVIETYNQIECEHEHICEMWHKYLNSK